MTRTRPALAPVWLAALALCACAAGPPPADHFYRLEVAGPAAPLPEPSLGGVLEIDRLRADTLTDQLPLLYREDGASEIRRHSYHRWVTPPSTMVQHELIGYLRAAGAATRVVPPEVRAEPDYHVGGRLARLERVLSGSGARVVVEIELSVSGGGGQLLLLESYRVEREARSDRVSDAVAAYDAALAEVFARFAADLAGLGR